MPRDFIPRRDTDFLAFTANFSQKISTAAGEFGLTPAQSAHYALTQQAFAAAFAATSAPSTRTTPAVAAKNTARDALEAETRMLAAIVRSHPAITDTQLCELRLRVPTDKRSRVPAPAVAPQLSYAQPSAARFDISLRDAETGLSRKPGDVRGAVIMAFAGDVPPADPLQWTLLSQTTRTKVNVAVALPPGARLWLTACWTGTRDDRGPWSTPISTRINFGGLMQRDSRRVRSEGAPTADALPPPRLRDAA